MFFDGAENGMIDWSEEDNWGTIFDASEGLFSITDSPVGNYIGDWGTSKTELTRIINFSGISSPFVHLMQNGISNKVMILYNYKPQ